MIRAAQSSRPFFLDMSRSKIDTAILVAGVMCAAASGVAAYRSVGPYADGPLNVGLYRAQDPETGRQLVYQQLKFDDGARLVYFYDDATRTLTERRLVGADGTVHVLFRAGDPVPLGRAGFSLRDNGITDAWEYRDAQGRLHKIEISRKQNGRVDRWEYYENDQLSRVEEDEDGDGRVDRWLTYEAGILVREAVDRNGDGRPDPGR